MNNGQWRVEEMFPIPSQTSHDDRLFLLKCIDLIKERVGRFRYFEVGSFLGGSLAPFLKEEFCDLVVSVDERGRQQPDERGAKFDYAGVTSDMMIKNLISHDISVSKLIAHDGPISTCTSDLGEFEMAFIDGEHTDVGAVRDFLWLHPRMRSDSIILFHDSSVVYNGLNIIREMMIATRLRFLILKHRESDICAIFQGAFADADYQGLFGEFEDWDCFQERAEIAMLSAVISNRLSVKVSYEIKPAPVYSAF